MDKNKEEGKEKEGEIRSPRKLSGAIHANVPATPDTKLCASSFIFANPKSLTFATFVSVISTFWFDNQYTTSSHPLHHFSPPPSPSPLLKPSISSLYERHRTHARTPWPARCREPSSFFPFASAFLFCCG